MKSDKPTKKRFQHNHTPKVKSPFKAQKSLGQHWLTDNTVVQAIVAATEAKPGDVVLEIGPGQGVLTDELVKTGATILALELDQRAVRHLQARYAEQPQVHIAHGDILALSPERFIELFPTAAQAEKLIVVGNLPYQITNRIFRHFMGDLATGAAHPWRSRVKHLTVMVQQEVAQRLVATPGVKAFSMLSLATQRTCAVDVILPSISPKAFRPSPKVYSAVVRLIPLPQPRLPDIPGPALQQVIEAAYSQRRKTLRNSLAAILPQPMVEAVLANVAPMINRTPAELLGTRAETLTLDDWGTVVYAFLNAGAPLKKTADKTSHDT